ncbi:MAG TPA: thermonuclease family protein [Pyrinomonadaceae bacterium]|nr:thermonuclease family protein [Pyrinomonadaceae bacterium]
MDLKPDYQFKGRITKIVDGDTLDAVVHLGFRVSIDLRLRLYGIDTPELRDADPTMRLNAQKAKARLIELTGNPMVLIKSHKPFHTEKFGRYLCQLYNSDGVNINQTLLDEGLAIPFMVDK